MSREVHVRFCERPEVKFLRPTHPYIPMARGFVYLVRVMELSAQPPTYGPDPDLNLIQIPPADHSRIERGTCTYPAAA